MRAERAVAGPSPFPAPEAPQSVSYVAWGLAAQSQAQACRRPRVIPCVISCHPLGYQSWVTFMDFHSLLLWKGKPNKHQAEKA